jgi:thiosulfate/3-mercaptopyruvate sulfurtransferase
MKGIPHNSKLLLRIFSFSILLSTYLFSWSEAVFANDLGLIEAKILNQNTSNWVILDARPKAEWLKGHIPGAISLSWENYTKTDDQGVPYRVWKPHELAKALGDMGINEKTTVVVYGDADTSWGGEGWDCWVLSWLGHGGPIRILSGGIQSWENGGFPLKKGDENVKNRAVQYKVKLNTAIDILTSEIETRKTNIALVDTRSTLEWFRGKIPGAIHIPWNDFYSGKERRPLPPTELKQLLRKNGVDTQKTVVYYCSGGIRSGYAWLVHQLSGLPSSINYEGGYEAWKKFHSK